MIVIALIVAWVVTSVPLALTIAAMIACNDDEFRLFDEVRDRIRTGVPQGAKGKGSCSLAMDLV